LNQCADALIGFLRIEAQL